MPPDFKFMSRFRRPPVQLSSTVPGGSDAVGSMLIKKGLRGESAGSGSGAVSASIKRVMRGLATGAAAAAGDLSAIPPSIYHLLIIGQSNAVGSATLGTDLSTVPGGLMFNAGVRPGGSGLTSFVILQDGAAQSIAPTLVQFLKNAVGVDPGGGSNVSFLISSAAVDGARYDDLKKGTTPYNNSLAQVTAAVALAAANGSAYHLVGLCLIHGEQDDAFNDSTYQADLATWQSDYQTDLNAITGQTDILSLYAVQQSTYSFNSASRTPPLYQWSTQIALLNAAIANPTKIKLVGPQYMYDSADGIHHTTAGRRRQGELFGKAIYRDYFLGGTFTPFLPLSASLTGSNIDIVFQVPVPPLAWCWDDILYSDKKGFLYWDDVSNFAAISSVSIIGSDTVRVALAAPPTGGNKRILYGGLMSLFAPGKPLGASGNLADSDSQASNRGYDLRNYCPHFNIPVT